MVFMMEKSMMAIMFVYAISIGFLGLQFVVFDVFHSQMTNFQGVPLKNNIINDIGVATINNVSGALGHNSTQTIAQAAAQYAAAVANIAIDLIMLITGLYIFDIMLQLGIPSIFIVGFVILYLFLLIRSIVGWVRGI